MALTKNQQKELVVWKYFIPRGLKGVDIVDEDIKMFFENSERGLHKDKVSPYKIDGFNALIFGKKWAGIHMHEMYEQGILDGTMPYFTILCGDDRTIKRKWWQFWKPKYTHKHNPVPVEVKDFMKKEMFKGIDAKIIEDCYQDILNDK